LQYTGRAAHIRKLPSMRLRKIGPNITLDIVPAAIVQSSGKRYSRSKKTLRQRHDNRYPFKNAASVLS